MLDTADFYGTDAAKLFAQQTSGGRQQVRMAHDAMIVKESYVFDGTEVADDEILLGRDLPAGCFLIPVLSRIHTVTQPAATALVADIGVNGVADNVIDGISINSVGIVTPTKQEIEITEATRIRMTLKTVTGTVTAGRQIDFYFVLRQTS